MADQFPHADITQAQTPATYQGRFTIGGVLFVNQNGEIGCSPALANGQVLMGQALGNPAPGSVSVGPTLTTVSTITGIASTDLVLNAGSGNQNIQLLPTGTGSILTVINSLGAATQLGYQLQNTTAATSGTQQWSPALAFVGAGWDSGSGGLNKPVAARIYLQPGTGTTATNINMVWAFETSLTANFASWNTAFTYTRAGTGAGTLAVTGALTTTTSITGLNITATGTFTSSGGNNVMMNSANTWTSGAGTGAGTLTNAPTNGNPTSWIPINDNGTTRYIPAW